MAGDETSEARKPHFGAHRFTVTLTTTTTSVKQKSLTANGGNRRRPVQAE